jgi:large subunit ribosomal protein L22
MVTKTKRTNTKEAKVKSVKTDAAAQKDIVNDAPSNGQPMIAKAVAKYLRVSPKKLRRIAQEIKGKSVADTLIYLKYLPNRPARYIEKVVASAAANAVTNHKMSEARLYIYASEINQGVILKRFRARSRGMAAPIQKKSSHIIVKVAER